MDFESTFAVNPNVNVLYAFADGNAFISQRDADNYGNQKGMKYEVVERKEKEVKPKKDK